jgi:hypothetical protein
MAMLFPGEEYWGVAALRPPDQKVDWAHLDTAPGATPSLAPFGVPPSGGPGCLVPRSRVNAGLQTGPVSGCAQVDLGRQPGLDADGGTN